LGQLFDIGLIQLQVFFLGLPNLLSLKDNKGRVSVDFHFSDLDGKQSFQAQDACFILCHIINGWEIQLHGQWNMGTIKGY
jgi:hypothetical protein